jgi:2-oxoglutarate dehydrogenase E1 component
MFHLLRRQVLRQARKPLIVMSPKSLLRHKLSVSTLEDICDKRFMPVIGDSGELVPGKVNRILVCSGKVYFDLLDAREERGLGNIALIRIEELYPFPKQLLASQLARYPNATEVVWCQEEPLNQGGWQFVRPYLAGQVAAKQTLSVVSRPASASPAVGYYQKHIQQLQILVNEAMGQSQSQENVSDMAYREMQ